MPGPTFMIVSSFLAVAISTAFSMVRKGAYSLVPSFVVSLPDVATYIVFAIDGRAPGRPTSPTLVQIPARRI